MYILNPTWFRYRVEEQKKPQMKRREKWKASTTVVPTKVPASKKKKIKVVKLKRSRPTVVVDGREDGRHVGKSQVSKKLNSVDGTTFLHLVRKRKVEPELEKLAVRPCRKRKRIVNHIEELELKTIIPFKKMRLQEVKVFGQNLTPKELDDEVFKFVRLCRCEVDCDNPKFFEGLSL
ncbi:uncharacterized protein LOC130655644 [Hydractinia symbiolongicarpus]|uniref:uncharacterized protein LOC130655644 n=1 Tax=Hydractinia symbiolongicarpus TaxID=13093 RepID=UPI002549DD9B|nr:uncharacterized protein LOC130655644 [Hydractinia symbiolongicarpus]